MNEKASVSKELNAKHVKILLGLLKLPENRECADCRSRAPSWASINLGIFICMQCSGIHRSLGVHISKVRSTTLDTWLPEQVAFMQVMGNQKANSYWEADLPIQFYRSPIEQFIYAKYVNKRWASTTSPQPMPEICVEKCVSTTRKEIPKKARRYSLDEESFKEMPKKLSPPTMHSRGESLDLMDMDAFVSAPPLISLEGCSSSKHVDATTDLFTLLYESEETHDRTVVPPSRWATFECEELTGGLFYSEDPICIACMRQNSGTTGSHSHT